MQYVHRTCNVRFAIHTRYSTITELFFTFLSLSLHRSVSIQSQGKPNVIGTPTNTGLCVSVCAFCCKATSSAFANGFATKTHIYHHTHTHTLFRCARCICIKSTISSYIELLVVVHFPMFCPFSLHTSLGWRAKRRKEQFELLCKNLEKEIYVRIEYTNLCMPTTIKQNQTMLSTILSQSVWTTIKLYLFLF